MGRSFLVTVLSLLWRGEAGAAAGHGSGTAPTGCFRLPAPARSTEGGAGHGAQVGATAPWRPEPHGAAPAMERGPPANGAEVRYSTQLQVRTYLGAGSSWNACQPLAELPRPLLALVPLSLLGSRWLWNPQEAEDSTSLLGKVRRISLGDVAERSRAEKNPSFGEGELSTCLCRLWISLVSVLPLLQGFWFQLKLRALEL